MIFFAIKTTDRFFYAAWVRFVNESLLSVVMCKYFEEFIFYQCGGFHRDGYRKSERWDAPDLEPRIYPRGSSRILSFYLPDLLPRSAATMSFFIC
jgi:hypothetical protein